MAPPKTAPNPPPGGVAGHFWEFFGANACFFFGGHQASEGTGHQRASNRWPIWRGLGGCFGEIDRAIGHPGGAIGRAPNQNPCTAHPVRGCFGVRATSARHWVAACRFPALSFWAAAIGTLAQAHYSEKSSCKLPCACFAWLPLPCNLYFPPKMFFVFLFQCP